MQFEIGHNTILFNLAHGRLRTWFLLWNTKYANVAVIQNDIGLVRALLYVLRAPAVQYVICLPLQ